MQRLKRFWWGLQSESKGLAFWFAAAMPGALGDWMRRAFLKRFLRHLGAKTRIQLSIRITNPEKVSVGDHCDLAQGVFITGGGGVQIGNWVGLGPDVKIWSVNHRYDDPDRPWLLQGWEQKPVTIEDDVWLGAGVFVMPGVTIGKGAIVAACSVITRAVPSYAIVAGNPGRVIGWRKRETVQAAGSPELVSSQDAGSAPEPHAPAHQRQT